MFDRTCIIIIIDFDRCFFHSFDNLFLINSECKAVIHISKLFGEKRNLLHDG